MCDIFFFFFFSMWWCMKCVQCMKNHLPWDSISTANNRNSKTDVYSKNMIGDINSTHVIPVPAEWAISYNELQVRSCVQIAFERGTNLYVTKQTLTDIPRSFNRFHNRIRLLFHVIRQKVCKSKVLQNYGYRLFTIANLKWKINFLLYTGSFAKCKWILADKDAIKNRESFAKNEFEAKQKWNCVKCIWKRWNVTICDLNIYEKR